MHRLVSIAISTIKVPSKVLFMEVRRLFPFYHLYFYARTKRQTITLKHFARYVELTSDMDFNTK